MTVLCVGSNCLALARGRWRRARLTQIGLSFAWVQFYVDESYKLVSVAHIKPLMNKHMVKS